MCLQFFFLHFSRSHHSICICRVDSPHVLWFTWCSLIIHSYMYIFWAGIFCRLKIQSVTARKAHSNSGIYIYIRFMWVTEIITHLPNQEKPQFPFIHHLCARRRQRGTGRPMMACAWFHRKNSRSKKKNCFVVELGNLSYIKMSHGQNH